MTELGAGLTMAAAFMASAERRLAPRYRVKEDTFVYFYPPGSETASMLNLSLGGMYTGISDFKIPAGPVYTLPPSPAIVFRRSATRQASIRKTNYQSAGVLVAKRDGTPAGTPFFGHFRPLFFRYYDLFSAPAAFPRQAPAVPRSAAR